MLSVAWLITSMYTLSWYDLIAWMPLAVLAASKLDQIMLMRITALSLAYVPGRAIDVGPAAGLHRRPGSGTPSRRSSRSRVLLASCCGGASPTGPSSSRSGPPQGAPRAAIGSPARSARTLEATAKPLGIRWPSVGVGDARGPGRRELRRSRGT